MNTLEKICSEEVIAFVAAKTSEEIVRLIVSGTQVRGRRITKMIMIMMMMMMTSMMIMMMTSKFTKFGPFLYKLRSSLPVVDEIEAYYFPIL